MIGFHANLELRDNRGMTAADLAKEKGHHDCWLLGLGESSSATDLNDNTPVKTGHMDTHRTSNNPTTPLDQPPLTPRNFGHQIQLYIQDMERVQQENESLKLQLKVLQEQFRSQMDIQRSEFQRKLKVLQTDYEQKISIREKELELVVEELTEKDKLLLKLQETHKQTLREAEEWKDICNKHKEQYMKSQEECQELKQKYQRMVLEFKKEKMDIMEHHNKELLRLRNENKRLLLDSLQSSSHRHSSPDYQGQVNNVAGVFQQLMDLEGKLESFNMSQLKDLEAQLHHLLFKIGESKVG